MKKLLILSAAIRLGVARLAIENSAVPVRHIARDIRTINPQPLGWSRAALSAQRDW
jgi:hypothetical protein